MVGRTFRDDEDHPGAPKVALISEGSWRRRFGACSRPLSANGTWMASPEDCITQRLPWEAPYLTEDWSLPLARVLDALGLGVSRYASFTVDLAFRGQDSQDKHLLFKTWARDMLSGNRGGECEIHLCRCTLRFVPDLAPVRSGRASSAAIWGLMR